MGERGDAVFLHLVENGDKLFPALRCLAAGGIERGLVDPHPVCRVDVHRRGNPVSVIFGEVLEGSRNNVGPAFFLGHIVQVGDDALFGPVDDVEAEHLHGRRRVACGDAGAQRGHGGFTATAGHRHVLPGDALGFQIFLENVQRCGFAARRPPVQNLNRVLGHGIAAGGHGKKGSARRQRGEFANGHDTPPNGIACSFAIYLFITL